MNRIKRLPFASNAMLMNKPDRQPVETGRDRIICAVCRTDLTEAEFIHHITTGCTSQWGYHQSEQKTLCTSCAYRIHMLWAGADEFKAYEGQAERSEYIDASEQDQKRRAQRRIRDHYQYVACE